MKSKATKKKRLNKKDSILLSIVLCFLWFYIIWEIIKHYGKALAQEAKRMKRARTRKD